MAIAFLQDNIQLNDEQWCLFYKNINSSEFEVEDLGEFSFKGDGLTEFDDGDRNRGVITYVVEKLDENRFYLFKLNFYYTDHFETSGNSHDDYTLYAVSKSESLNY
jgi:hypothetical protein